MCIAFIMLMLYIQSVPTHHASISRELPLQLVVVVLKRSTWRDLLYTQRFLQRDAMALTTSIESREWVWWKNVMGHQNIQGQAQLTT